ncbi:flagellar biosynthetic protein FliO [Pectinatus sottacetonis]|uniref:flagellar biosynthetic protein FliO n=1 Tax=Pectinatus sottacetonis TaxID=1002795 RepID=UPI0018C5907E|nr:flagellar biosynthetic protein FliO [Pectinatus sottacetonis]
MKKYKSIALSAAIFLFCWFVPVYTVLAAGDSSSGGYLSQYQNTNPHPTSVSWISTLGYLLSLIAIFAFVVGLAYYVSHYLGGHFAKSTTQSDNISLLSHFSLGPNRSICIVDIAGHILILGVTDHNISLLKEITDDEEITKLRLATENKIHQKDILGVFGQQFNSLEKISKRIPGLFKNKYHK